MHVITTQQPLLTEQIDGIPVDFSVTLESLQKKGKSKSVNPKEVKVHAALNQALGPYKGAGVTVSCRREAHKRCFETRKCTADRNALLNEMVTVGALTEPVVKKIVERAKDILQGKIPKNRLKVNV